MEVVAATSSAYGRDASSFALKSRLLGVGNENDTGDRSGTCEVIENGLVLLLP